MIDSSLTKEVLKNLQALHDNSAHLSDYLRELSNFNQIPEVKDV